MNDSATEPGRVAARGDRRYLTVLFADLCASSEHAERMEAEDFAELLEEMRRLARDTIPRHGGRIARLQGDGLLAIFGYPVPHEDDGRRATEAALELHSRVSRLRIRGAAGHLALQMHSGIHAGLVLLVDGDLERGRFDLVGEVPNTAARLCDLAERGEIVVSEETLGPQRHLFRVDVAERASLRGRSAPLAILRVSGRADGERRFDAAARRRGLSRYVGREGEQAELAALAERTARGDPTALIVMGEPGIGKTRLLEEFRARLDPARFRVLQGFCENYLGAEPLQPFLQVVREVLGWRPGIGAPQIEAAAHEALGRLGADPAGDLVPLLQAVLPRRADAGTPPAPLPGSAILELLARVARSATVVLELDDWQWADDASRHLLDEVLARRLPLMVLLASRPDNEDDLPIAGVRVLRLHPLLPEAAKGAITTLLPQADPFLAQEIERQAGGSPLFIEELCHAAAAGRPIDGRARHGGGAAWISALVASRVARLPPEQAQLLQVASVAGTAFPAWLLKRLTGHGERSALAVALAEQDFLFPAEQSGMLRFKHALTRDAVYATVPPERRRALHTSVARQLESGSEDSEVFDWQEALAYHYDAAGVGDRAARYGESAGDKAMAAMALDRARTQYLTALRALDTLPELNRERLLQWCNIAQKLGMACVFDPLDLPNGLTYFERAVELAGLAGDDNALARAEYWLGYMYYAKGLMRRAARHGQSALALAERTADERLAVQVRATLGQVWVSAGDYRRAQPLLDGAVEVKKRNIRSGSRAAIGSAYTLARKAYMLGDQGRFPEADACFEESLMLAGDAVHPIGASIRELIAAVRLWQGRWDEARDAALGGADIALRCRSRYLTAMGRALGACATWALRGDDASLTTLRESTAWIALKGGAVSTSLNYGWLVQASVHLGDVREARHQATLLLHRSRTLDRHGEAMGRRALARLACAGGDLPRAAHHLRHAEAVADLRDSDHERANNRLARAWWHRARGEHPQAREALAEATAAYERLGMPWHLARARALGPRFQGG